MYFKSLISSRDWSKKSYFATAEWQISSKIHRNSQKFNEIHTFSILFLVILDDLHADHLVGVQIQALDLAGNGLERKGPHCSRKGSRPKVLDNLIPPNMWHAAWHARKPRPCGNNCICPYWELLQKTIKDNQRPFCLPFCLPREAPTSTRLCTIAFSFGMFGTKTISMDVEGKRLSPVLALFKASLVSLKNYPQVEGIEDLHSFCPSKKQCVKERKEHTF